MEDIAENVCFVCSADPDCCQRLGRLIVAHSGWKVIPVGDPSQLRETLQGAGVESLGRGALVLDLTFPGRDGTSPGHEVVSWQIAVLVALALRASRVPTLVVTTFEPLTTLLAEQGVSIAAQVAPQDSDVAWQQALTLLLASPSPEVDTRSARAAQDVGEVPSTQIALREQPPLLWDTQAGTLIRDGEVISLTPREHALLEILARTPGRVFSARTIAQLATQPEAPHTMGSHAVEQVISGLRRKLGDDTASMPLLVNRRGFGYTLVRLPVQSVGLLAHSTELRRGEIWGKPDAYLNET